MVLQRWLVKKNNIKLTEDHAIATSMSHLMKYHCMVHREDLCTKALKMDSVMQILIKTEFHEAQRPESSQISAIP